MPPCGGTHGKGSLMKESWTRASTKEMSPKRRTTPWRRRATTVSAVLLGLATAACGGDTTSPQADESPDSQAESGECADFPNERIDLIIPWPAGSASDLAIRLITQFAEEELGVTIAPTNQVGGNGSVAWEQLAAAEPDGYTVGLLTFDVLTNQALGDSSATIDDFDFLMQFTTQPMAVYVLADSPYEDIEALLEAAEQEPGQLSMATTALGGVFHQAAGLLEQESGATFQYVPFDGSSDLMAAGLGGHVDAFINTLSLPAQYVENGTVRMLATFEEERLETYPDVPTFEELGMDVVYNSWRGVGLPVGVPEECRQIILDAYTAAFENPEFQDRAVEAEFDPLHRGPEEFTELVQESYPVVKDVMVDLGFADA